MSYMAYLSAPGAYQRQRAILAQVQLITAHVVASLGWGREGILLNGIRYVAEVELLMQELFVCESDV